MDAERMAKFLRLARASSNIIPPPPPRPKAIAKVGVAASDIPPPPPLKNHHLLNDSIPPPPPPRPVVRPAFGQHTGHASLGKSVPAQSTAESILPPPPKSKPQAADLLQARADTAYKGVKVAVMREELASLGLPVDGLRKDLALRLLSHHDAQEAVVKFAQQAAERKKQEEEEEEAVSAAAKAEEGQAEAEAAARAEKEAGDARTAAEKEATEAAAKAEAQIVAKAEAAYGPLSVNDLRAKLLEVDGTSQESQKQLAVRLFKHNKASGEGTWTLLKVLDSSMVRSDYFDEVVEQWDLEALEEDLTLTKAKTRPDRIGRRERRRTSQSPPGRCTAPKSPARRSRSRSRRKSKSPYSQRHKRKSRSRSMSASRSRSRSRPRSKLRERRDRKKSQRSKSRSPARRHDSKKSRRSSKKKLKGIKKKSQKQDRAENSRSEEDDIADIYAGRCHMDQL